MSAKTFFSQGLPAICERRPGKQFTSHSEKMAAKVYALSAGYKNFIS
jgi:hypothetical protein